MSDIVERAENALKHYHCHSTTGVIVAYPLISELIAELKTAHTEVERLKNIIGQYQRHTL